MGSESDFVALRDLSTRITKGTTPPRGKGFVDHGINYIKSEAISPDGSIDTSKFAFIDEKTHSSLARSQLQTGDVLFSMAGVYLGKTSVVKAEHLPANTNQAVGIITLDGARADPYFIHYVLQSPHCRSWVARSAAQSAQPNFNLKEIGDLPIPNLPLHLQQGVSNALKALDDRIDLLRQTNTTLETIAQALFKSWFVDFDPVHAKAEGRDPEAMDAATAALFPSEFEDSELGPIPKGWRVDEIGNAVKCLGGGTPSTKEDAYWIDGEHHWVTPKDLAALQAPVLTATSRRITDAGLSRISSGLLPRGTLLMSSRAPIGYLALAGIPTAINQGFIAMPPGRTLPPVYLFFWTRANMDAIKQKANGSTFMEISKSAFRPIKLCVPLPRLVDAFVAVASPLMDRIEANEHHRVALTELRDTLLPRLISGKLRLPEAAEAAEAALA